MHDPLVQAFMIRRPWPARSKLPIAGRRRRWWPPLVTIWHVEPGNRDSGEVCPHTRRWQETDGRWRSEPINRWRWHLHHWHLQIHPLQALNRRLRTRCVNCGGRSTKQYPVDCGSWSDDLGYWWRKERDLWHSTCPPEPNA